MPNIIKSSLAKDAGFFKVPFRNLAVDNGVKDIRFSVTEVKDREIKEQDLSCAEDEGRRLIAEAVAQADAIVAQALQDAGKIREDAGNAARAEAQKEKERLLTECCLSLNTAEQIRQELIRSAEGQVVELSIHIARCLIRSSVLLEPAIIKNIVAEAVALAAGDGEIQVKVNPAELAACREYRAFIQGQSGQGAGMKFLPADEVTRGSCVVQGRFARVESLLEERFSRLREALLAEAGNEA